MNLFVHFLGIVLDAVAGLVADGVLPPGLATDRIAVEPTRDAQHGDISTNAAMILAKPAGKPPRVIADALAARLRQHGDVVEVAVAGPGFINLRLARPFWLDRLGDVLNAGTAYGDSFVGQGEPVNVEFVSANPTGPMHVGHGRGAVFGDALAALLAKAGYKVTREYYINDAGAQVEALARSLHWRYRERLAGDQGPMPEGLYPGAYLADVAATLATRDGDRWLDAPEHEWLEPLRAYAVDAMLALIRDDLAALGIRFDVFTSERQLVQSGAVDRAIRHLTGRELMYTGVLEPPKGMLPEDWEPRPQLLFRATRFGDDVDRPVRKSDGSWTYFATDMAYHLDKVNRGFSDLIDVWGADHGGYVKRMQAAVQALTEGKGRLDVKLCQMVNLLDGGEPVRMSKRAGTFVTLRDVVDRVGKDVVRFIMLTRKNDQHLDFDLQKVVEESKDNPVFYVQYAHARVRSVMRHAADMLGAARVQPSALAQAPVGRLNAAEELDLVKTLANWPRAVEAAAQAHEPHRIAFYLYDLAKQFHGLWTKGKEDTSLRFLVENDPDLTLARLALLQAVAFVIASGLAVFGVTPAEEMR
ncbi:MAG: arginine--tRNA ligase [Alphaproteobacteria bacterium]|nr:arginine--tRNA ligase [Alphaproteobacteria bacterium]